MALADDRKDQPAVMSSRWEYAVGRSTGTAWSDGAIRGEAVRLVSGVFEVAARAARDLPGEPDCGCPVCRTVSAVREPDPVVTAKVADAVGEAASGLAGVLRTLAELGSHRPATPGTGGPDGSDGNVSDGAAGASDTADGPGGAAPDGGDLPGRSADRAETPQRASGAARTLDEQQKGDVGCH